MTYNGTMEITDAPPYRHGRDYRSRWSESADGQWRLARPDIDYSNVVNFATAGRIWASRNGYRWSQSTCPEGIKFRIWRPEISPLTVAAEVNVPLPVVEAPDGQA